MTTNTPGLAWKPNWAETREHLVGWWERRDFAVGLMSGPPARSRRDATIMTPPGTREEWLRHPQLWARHMYNWLAGQDYPLESFPLCYTDYGPGSLPLMLGSEPLFQDLTIWIEPFLRNDTAPEQRPPFVLDPGNGWWQTHVDCVRECRALGEGKYLIGAPDLGSPFDNLATIRGVENLMMDLYERPGWVEEKCEELFAAWQQGYDLLEPYLSHQAGGWCYGAFHLWAPGRVTIIQCDSATMMSAKHFRKFVLPHVKRQCQALDYSLFHLDGRACLDKLDMLLEIEELDAIQWNPDPDPNAGDPQWYDLLRRILAAGKSIEGICVRPEQVGPLLDAIGTKGVYLLADTTDGREIEQLEKTVERFR